MTVAPSASSAANRSGAAAGGDYVVRAEKASRSGRPCDPHFRRGQNEHVLAGLELHPPAQRDPGRHRRVHRRGDRDRVDGFRQHNAAPDVDDGRSAIAPIVVSGRTK